MVRKKIFIILFIIIFSPSLYAGFNASPYQSSAGQCYETRAAACSAHVGQPINSGETSVIYDSRLSTSGYQCEVRYSPTASWISRSFGSCTFVPPPPEGCLQRIDETFGRATDTPWLIDSEGCLAECAILIDFNPETPTYQCTYTGETPEYDESGGIIPPERIPPVDDINHCEVIDNTGLCLDSNHPDNAVNGDGSQAEGCPDTRPQYGTIGRDGKSYNVCVAGGSQAGGDGISFGSDPNAPVNTGGSGAQTPGNDSDSGSSGGGSAAPDTGTTGGGSTDPSTWGDLGDNDFYEAGKTGSGQELTYSNILTNFQFRVAESAVGSSWKNFFNASLTGSCPTYSVSAWIFNITFDQWCSPIMPWGLIAGVIMACALYMAGRIAFT